MLDVETAQPKPILHGRHLIELGYQPASWFGEVLQECFESQLAGKFASFKDGRYFLQALLESNWT